jgi:ABC-type multidrug transport system permease subunit
MELLPIALTLTIIFALHVTLRDGKWMSFREYGYICCLMLACISLWTALLITHAQDILNWLDLS